MRRLICSQGWSERSERNPWTEDVDKDALSPGGATDSADGWRSVAPPGLIPSYPRRLPGAGAPGYASDVAPRLKTWASLRSTHPTKNYFLHAFMSHNRTSPS